jgi:hypothetical protein
MPTLVRLANPPSVSEQPAATNYRVNPRNDTTSAA